MTGIREALDHVFVTNDEHTNDMEPANVADGLFAIARALTNLAKTIERVGDKVCLRM